MSRNSNWKQERTHAESKHTFFSAFSTFKFFKFYGPGKPLRVPFLRLSLARFEL
jgi:hypothetical protein